MQSKGTLNNKPNKHGQEDEFLGKKRYFLTSLSFSPVLHLKCPIVFEEDGLLVAKSHLHLC